LACAKHLFAGLPVGCQLYANGAAVTLTLEEHVSSFLQRPIVMRRFDTYWSGFGLRRKGNSLQACLAKFAGLSGTSYRRPEPRQHRGRPFSCCPQLFFKFPRASNLIQVRNFSETPSRPCA
jgi:hypothetical protein